MLNLRPHDYFMELHADAARLELGIAMGAQSHLSGGSLVMDFTVPVNTHVDISKSKMVFSVYDPTYYIQFEHVKYLPISFEGPGAATCYARIKQATPSAEALRAAQAMDRNAAVNPSLGRMFAQTVFIGCG